LRTAHSINVINTKKRKLLTGIKVLCQQIIIPVPDSIKQPASGTQEKETIVSKHNTHQLFEYSRFIHCTISKEASRDLVKHFSEPGTLLVDVRRVV